MEKDRARRFEFLSFKIIEMKFECIKQHKEEQNEITKRYFDKFPYVEPTRESTLRKYGLEHMI